MYNVVKALASIIYNIFRILYFMKMFKFIVDAYERNAASLLQCSSNSGFNENRLSLRKQESKRSNPDSPRMNPVNEKEDLSPRKRYLPNSAEGVDSQRTLNKLIIRAESGELELHKKFDKREFSCIECESNVLGQGVHGIVYRGEYKSTTVAVKKIKLTGMNERDWKKLRREVAIMSLVSHRNVATCQAACIAPNEANGYIITELFEKGNLEELINSELDSWGLAKSLIISQGIAEGMRYLAYCGIIHRDLKPANILITKDYTPVITDYGLSRALSFDKVGKMTIDVGTPMYMAPELFKATGNVNYGSEVDVYSFGVIFWQLVTKQEPYSDFDEGVYTFKELVYEGLRPKLIEGLPPTYNEFIADCWHKDPLARPNFTDIVKNLSTFSESCEESEKSIQSDT